MSTEPPGRIKLTLHYDGAGFHGWQIQPGVRTVQGELDAALSRLADRPIVSTAAGRTDAGVHATGQVVSVAMPEKWSPGGLRKSLNAVLPLDIWVADTAAAPATFHARYGATARGYIYRVGTTDAARSPFRRGWCWPVAEPLDRAVLDDGARAIVGEHSFRGYAKSGQPERGYRCTVHVARWTEWPGGLEFRVVANRFLHHMVRYLVGTMVDAARGRRPATDIAALLDVEGLLDDTHSRETRPPTNDARALETSPPAPAEGLFLARVYYDDEQPNPKGPENEDLP